MAVTFSSFIEKFEDTSPASAGCSMQGGRAVMTLFLENPTLSDLQDALTTILGTTNPDTGDGRLQRTLPMAHPIWPYLYASSISDIRGIGQPTKTVAANKLEAPTLPFFLLYPWYAFTVEFTPRPYLVATDKSIPLLKNQKFYDESGTQQTTIYAAEWVRYTDFQAFPQNENITCQLGFMKFRTKSGATPGDGVQFAGQPRIFIPNQHLKIWWTGIPYRYINSKNSFISRYIGYVNQNDFGGWKAGQLQYINYNAKRYSPPVQKLDPFYTGTQGNLFSTEKLCDIEFDFLLTTRKVTDAPDLSGVNKNWIAAYHNAMPWLTTRKYYYASTEDPQNPSDQTKQYPLWLSIPYELLFTDPDAAGVYQIPA